MRWMHIDRVVELVPGERLVAVKTVSLSEDHLHEHFSAARDASGAVVLPADPVMPGSLIVEGMAQSAGILVGHAEGFAEKVVLAKLSKVELDADAAPGDTLRYTATIRTMTSQGASTVGLIERRLAGADAWEAVGRADLLFSHLDHNAAGVAYPEHNFVFGEAFRTLLRTSGVEVD